jgi:UDP-glucuronate decarboxylase
MLLVTGGAGFIGSHLCERLLGAGHEVLCVDNYFTGSRSNVAHLMADRRFELLRHDVTFPLYVEVDEIYNLACPASPVHYQHDPVQTVKTSVHGAINVLGLAKRTGAKILQASTSEVYGDPQVHPQSEEYWGHVNPIGPRGVYDEAKRYAEALTMAYHRQQGVDTCIVRIFNTYGPRMRPHDGRAIPTFLRQALQDKPITVFGEGEQTRSFCFVDDLIRGLILLADSEFHMPVNIGNPDEKTILELAEAVIAATESRSEIVHEALPVDDPQTRQPDTTRAREILGWEPPVSLAEGLRRTIELAGAEGLIGSTPG